MRILYSILLIILFIETGIAEEKNINTRIELSYAQTSGNTKTENSSGNLDIEGKFQKNSLIIRSGYLMAKDNHKEKANKLNAEIRYEQVFTSRIFGFIESTYLRDQFSGYDYRFSTGPGIGINIIRKEKHALKLMLSGRYDFEKSSISKSEYKSFATGKADCEYSSKLKEHVTVKGKVDYLTALEQMEKYFINAETALEVALSGQISIGLKILVNYQNDVPSPEIKTTDTAFTTSIILNL